MPGMKTLSLVVTEKLTKAQKQHSFLSSVNHEIPDMVHWCLLVLPRCKSIPGMKPLSLVVTEKLTLAQKLNIFPKFLNYEI